MDAIKLSSLEGPINYLAYSLKRKGITPGEKVAFIASNERSVVILFLALFRLGAIACPLSTRFPNLKPYLDILKPEFLLDVNQLSFAKAPLLSYQIREDQLATMIFTSGSSAQPKIACHTYGNHLYSALGINERLPFGAEESWHLSLPLYHVAGIAILFRCLVADATLLLMKEPLEKATHLSLVPTQLFRLDKPLQATILIGGAPIAPSLYLKGYHLRTSYGLTEMSSTVTLDGQILPYREIKLAPDGEILVRGKTLFQGYYLEAPVQPGEWFHTRDLGVMIDKKMHIIGRKDNLFISGGENIQPEEIEKALMNLPGIEQAVVIPQKDLEFGYRPVAFIHAPSTTYTSASIRKLLEKKLPTFKIPVRILPFPEQCQTDKPSRAYLSHVLTY